MATAVVSVIPPDPPEPVKEYSLVLSEKEAIALVNVLGAVGGSPSNSGRKHTQAILDALTGVGVNEPISGLFKINACRIYWEDGEGL